MSFPFSFRFGLGLLAGLLLAGPLVRAQETAMAYISGNTLNENFIAGGGDFAFGYVIGVHDAAQWTNQPKACIEHGVLSGQVRDVVKKWLSDHPEMRNKGGVPIVRQAMAEAWPCRK